MATPIDFPITDPGLSVTSQALAHIRRSLQKTASSKNPIGIRVGVKKAGCSGYEYVLEYAYSDSQQPWDFVFTFEEVAILVDQEMYWKFLKGGTTLNFYKEGVKEELSFQNPNVAHQCGCGESFTLIDDDE